jgi:hypothetical protein
MLSSFNVVRICVEVGRFKSGYIYQNLHEVTHRIDISRYVFYVVIFTIDFTSC